MNKVHVKTGDEVIVINGKDRGKKGKVLERECSYIADFVYDLPDGGTVIEDCKGMRTPAYKIKKKLMLHIHGIQIKES